MEKIGIIKTAKRLVERALQQGAPLEVYPGTIQDSARIEVGLVASFESTGARRHPMYTEYSGRRGERTWNVRVYCFAGRT